MRTFLLAYIAALAWIGFWVCSHVVTRPVVAEDEVAQPLVEMRTLCDTDMDCEYYERCKAGDAKACEVRL